MLKPMLIHIVLWIFLFDTAIGTDRNFKGHVAQNDLSLEVENASETNRFQKKDEQFGADENFYINRWPTWSGNLYPPTKDVFWEALLSYPSGALSGLVGSLLTFGIYSAFNPGAGQGSSLIALFGFYAFAPVGSSLIIWLLGKDGEFAGSFWLTLLAETITVLVGTIINPLSGALVGLILAPLVGTLVFNLDLAKKKKLLRLMIDPRRNSLSMAVLKYF